MAYITLYRYNSYLADHNIIVGNGASLNIIDASKDHSGNYTCTAHNDAGHTKHQFHVAVLQKPRFTQRPKSKSSPPSRTVRLNCSVEGFPEPKIRWLKNGESLNYTARIKIQRGQLVFSHTFSSDSGRCLSFVVLRKLRGCHFYLQFTFGIVNHCDTKTYSLKGPSNLPPLIFVAQFCTHISNFAHFPSRKYSDFLNERAEFMVASQLNFTLLQQWENFAHFFMIIWGK